MPIVAGIIVSAVGDEMLLAHPDGHSDSETILSMIGGPLLFLLGTILFKQTIRGYSAAVASRRHRRCSSCSMVRSAICRR